MHTTFVLYGFLYRFLTSLTQVLIGLETILCGLHLFDIYMALFLPVLHFESLGLHRII